MKLKSLNIKSKLSNFIENKDKIAVLSISFLFISIFLFVISLASPSKSLKNQRSILSVINFYISFYIIPIIGMEAKDKIVLEISRLLINMSIALGACYYWLITINNDKVFFLIDVVMTFLIVYVIYYFIYRIYLITKVFIKFINTLTTNIFPNSKATPSGLKYLFERLTTVLISLSGILATVLTIAKTIETIIVMFNK